jgi:transposase InsO family protein
LLFDRDAKFGGDVREFLKASDIKPIRTSVRSPWQNGIAEGWIGSARRDLFDHVIPLNEQHGGLAANTSLITMTTEPTSVWRNDTGKPTR